MALSYAFMLNPRKTRSRSKTKKRKSVAGHGRKKWGICLSKAGGDPKLASKLYRAKPGCSRMRKVRKKTRAAARKRATTARWRTKRGRLTWKQAMKLAGGKSKKASTLYRRSQSVTAKKRKRSNPVARTRKNPKRAAAARAAWRRRKSGLKPRRKRRGRVTAAQCKRHKRRRKTSLVKGQCRRKKRRNPVASSNPRRRRRRRKSTRKHGIRRTARRAYMGRRKRRLKRRRRNPVRARRNPSRRRRRVRRNPGIMGGLKRARRLVMDPKMYAKFAAGAAGMAVGKALGGVAHKFLSKQVSALGVGYVGQVVKAVLEIGAATVVAGFIPSKFQDSFILGAGIGAVEPVVASVVNPVISSIPGLSGYISDIQMHSVPGEGYPGVSGYIALDQARQLGLSGHRGGLGRGYTWQPGQQHAFTM